MVALTVSLCTICLVVGYFLGLRVERTFINRACKTRTPVDASIGKLAVVPWGEFVELKRLSAGRVRVAR